MAVHAGSWSVFGRALPDFGLTEALASRLGKQPTYQGGSNLSGPQPTRAATPQVQGAQDSRVPYGPAIPTANNRIPTSGGGGSQPQQYNPSPDPYAGLFDSQRSGAEDSSRRQLEAALGVFEAQKAKTMNRIPGVQQAAALRIKGLDQGYEDFTNTANMEESKRIAGLGNEATQINEQYTAAGRQTRNAAQSLEKSLRNRFAALGTLDSTQYRDMNIEQSTDIARSLGDTRREQAGKLTANTREQEDMKQYYASQRLQEQKRVQLAKEQVQSETDSLVQSIIDDGNISDAQKIEAIQQAQARLDARLSDLDMQEMQLTQSRAKDEQEFAQRQAELQNKGYSSSYTQAKDKMTALKNMTAILDQHRNADGTLALAPEAIKSVARTAGYPEEELDEAVAYFGVPVKKKPGSTGGADAVEDYYNNAGA